MSKSIRISDELATRATEAGRLFHRSPPRQIEHWAQIGRVMETVLSYPAQSGAARWGREGDIDAVIAESQSPKGRSKLRAAIHRGSGGEFWEVAEDDSQGAVNVVKAQRVDG